MAPLVPGCASDYVNIRPNPGGWLQDRRPTAQDKTFYASIGAKQFETYRWDGRRAAETESARLVETFGLCPRGYTLKVDTRVMTGDHGFGWTILCND
jgi:hypothetical protein